jgi:hypothetical protein
MWTRQSVAGVHFGWVRLSPQRQWKQSIRKGALIQDVAKMLGDTVAMVERHYLPYIEELKDAHVATNKRILEAAGAD